MPPTPTGTAGSSITDNRNSSRYSIGWGSPDRTAPHISSRCWPARPGPSPFWRFGYAAATGREIGMPWPLCTVNFVSACDASAFSVRRPKARSISLRARSAPAPTCRHRSATLPIATSRFATARPTRPGYYPSCAAGSGDSGLLPAIVEKLSGRLPCFDVDSPQQGTADKKQDRHSHDAVALGSTPNQNRRKRHQRRSDNCGKFSDHIKKSEKLRGFAGRYQASVQRSGKTLYTALNQPDCNSQVVEVTGVGEPSPGVDKSGDIDGESDQDRALRPDAATEPAKCKRRRECNELGDKQCGYQRRLGQVQNPIAEKHRGLDDRVDTIDIQPIPNQEKQEDAQIANLACGVQQLAHALAHGAHWRCRVSGRSFPDIFQQRNRKQPPPQRYRDKRGFYRGDGAAQSEQLRFLRHQYIDRE